MSTETMATSERTGQSRALFFLTTSMFVSSIGTTLLLVGTSVAYLRGTGSALAAGMVYVAQFLPPIFLAPLVARVCDRVRPRPLLTAVELCSLAIALAIGILFTTSYAAVMALLVVRGALDMTMKSARGVAAKHYLSAERLARGNTVLNAGYYLGAATGGLIGVSVIGRLSMFEVSLINAVTFLVSAGLYAALAPLPARPAGDQPRGGAWRQTLRALSRDTGLARAFGYLVLSVTLLQGVNQVLRVWLPLQWLGLPASGGALAETIGLAGVMTGVLIVAVWLSGEKALVLLPPLLMGASLAFLLGTTATRSPPAVFLAYFGFIVTFEVIYTRSLNDMLVHARHDEVPFLMAAFYGGSFAGMTVTVIAVGLLIDRFGLRPVLLGLAVAAGTATAAVELVIRPSPSLLKRKTP